MMIEIDWLRCNRPVDMIKFLEKMPNTRRRLRLFGCACCRSVWHLLQRDAARKIVELSEAFADGIASESDLKVADNASELANLKQHLTGTSKGESNLTICSLYAIFAARDLASSKFSAIQIALDTSRDIANDFVPTADYNETTGRGTGYDDNKLFEKVLLIRDIFGNPYQVEPFKAEWRDEHTIGIASNMYSDRRFDAMPILADALEDAGCDNSSILNHCRKPSLHVLGCWVIDLILAKEPLAGL